MASSSFREEDIMKSGPPTRRKTSITRVSPTISHCLIASTLIYQFKKKFEMLKINDKTPYDNIIL